MPRRKSSRKGSGKIERFDIFGYVLKGHENDIGMRSHILEVEDADLTLAEIAFKRRAEKEGHIY